MLTDLGPGVIPHQFALIRSPTSTGAYLAAYFAVKYAALHQLVAAHWDTRDPVFFDQCNGARPQGAVELSWLAQQVLTGTFNPTLPRIPRSQVRYLPARTFVVLARNIASILESVRPAFVAASTGTVVGMGLTSYGPMALPMNVSLTDVQAQREPYAVSMTVHDEASLGSLSTNPSTQLNQMLRFFSNGGVELHLTYTPLGGGRSRAHTVDLLLPLDPLRVILRAQERITHAQGRMAALI